MVSSRSDALLRIVLAIVLAVLMAGSTAAPRSAAPRFASDVPDDVRRLALAVWSDTARALPARAGCLAGATIATDRELEDRARYHPRSATIVLRIRATAAQLSAALIHEFAHHVEHTCADHVALRPAFLAAQGHPAGTDWFGGGRWEDRPSEQYAEAMIVHVRGRRGFRRQMRIDERAVAVVAAWAGCPVGGCRAPR